MGKNNSRREEMVRVFNDTLLYIEENATLGASLAKSREGTVFYTDMKADTTPSKKGDVYLNNVFVTGNRTFEAAIELSRVYPKHRIAVLNFASAANPGGGVRNGSSAQEESLCRCSTLYPCLDTDRAWKEFYSPHRKNPSPLHNNDIIYTPSVTICKSDDGRFTRLPEDDFVDVDVITCAAPNLRERPSNQYNNYGMDLDAANISDETLYGIHLERARCILNVAKEHGAKVLVLGAFGCGAFRNDPHVVARAYREALKDYAGDFVEIEFAIYCRSYEDENYKAFDDVFCE